MKNFVAALTFRFVDRLSNPARSAARAVGTIERAQKMADRAGKQWSRGIDVLDRRLNSLANVSLVTEGIGRAGQVMIRPLVQGTRDAAAFDRGMTGIGITAQLTDRQLAPLRRTIMATSSELGALPGTVQATFGAVLAEGVYRTEAELSRAGVAMARFQRLQATMGEPLSDAEAGSFSSALGTSMRLRADQLDRANAMLNRSAQQGGISGAVLARALPAQTGAMSGLSFANNVGLADLLAANQIAKRLAGSSEQATNNITNLFAAMGSPETIKNFSEAGINLEQEIKAGIRRGVSPLETLASLVQRATGGDQFRIGELFGDRQARDGIMALTQNIDDFRTMSRELQGDDVLASYMADLKRAADGPAASFDRYTAGVARAGIATGTILAPAVSVAADWLGRVANWMSRAAESANPLARAAVWVVAGFAGVAVGAGAVGHAVMGVLAPLWIMRSLFGDLGGAAAKRFAAGVIGGLARARMAALAFNITMLANPVVLAVAAAIAAVAVVALVVRKYWQPISAFFVGFGRGLGAAFAPLGAALAPLKPLWDGLVGGVRAAGNWVMRLLQPVKSTQAQLAGATSAGERFGRILGAAIMGVIMPFRAVMTVGRMLWPVLRTLFAFSPAGMIVTHWRPIVSVVGTVVRGAIGVVRAVWSGARALFAWSPLGMIITNWRPIVATVRGVIGGAIDGVRYGWAVIRAALSWSPLGVLRTAWAAAGGFFGGLAARFAGFGRSVIQGMINGILSMLGAVGSAVGQVGSSAVTAIRNRLGIRSPSRVFAALGGDTMDGLTLGLKRGGRGAVATVASVAAALVAANAVSLTAPARAVAEQTPVTPGISVVSRDDRPPAPTASDEPRRPGRPPAPPADDAWRYDDFTPSADFPLDAPSSAPRAEPAIPRTQLAPSIGTLVQHFHLPPSAGKLNPRELAKELARLGRQGQRAALDDGGEG